MVDQSQGVYFLAYAIVCALMIVTYLKYRSTEGTVITTKEFQLFQSTFLTGYVTVILCELIASASFYHTFIGLKLSLLQVTKLYIATIVSTTVTAVLTEVVDVGSRKDKCVFSAVLYSISMFSVFFGGHFELLLMGRLVYGAGAALQHSAFEAYAVHEHNVQGFPDDWLGHTFSLLTHCMALMSALSGVLGLAAAGSGPLGCPVLCCVLFAAAGGYMLVVWEKDSNSPRFMLSTFLGKLGRAVNTVQSNKQVSVLVTVSALCETSIAIFTFYWAPWISAMASEEDKRIPFELIFATFVMASLVGNYLFQMYAHSLLGGTESAFQALMVAASTAYFLGAIFQTPLMAFISALAVQFCVGGYWPSIGQFRGRVVPPDLRNTFLVIPRVTTLVLSIVLLTSIHHSPLLLLASCAALTGTAAYVHITYADVSKASDDEGLETGSEYSTDAEDQ